jgi:hypothetical protein
MSGFAQGGQGHHYKPHFSQLSTIDLGDEGAAEIAAYDRRQHKLFVVNNSVSPKVDVVDLSDPANPQLLTSLDMSSYGGSVNSVAVSHGKLAVAVEAVVKQNNGTVVVLDTNNYQLITSLTVGALPDMVTFTKNGKQILVANEGEPNDAYTVDPEGTINIIEHTGTGWSNTSLNFNAFNGQAAALIAQGLRVYGPGANLSQDLEPEYIAVSNNNQHAWVTLQENNAMAKIDLINKTIESILPFGYKDHSLSGNELDASNKDGVINIQNWPILGTYQPDAIAFFSHKGQPYLLTANEGDSRDYGGYSEETRVGDLILDPTVFPDAANLQLDENLGRLKTTTAQGDTDNDGDHDVIYSYGARSFSIWSGGTANLVYDSGSDIANQTKTVPALFNNDEGEFDDRSDDKGAEPEGVVVGKMRGKNYAFIGLERTGGVLVYDITKINTPKFIQWVNSTADMNPEGLLFVRKAHSPNHKNLLIVANEVTGTVTIYQSN